MTPDFIEVYDDLLPPDLCDAWIAAFETSGQARCGETGSGADPALTDSWVINLDLAPGWTEVRNVLNGAMLQAFKRYLRRYPHLALAPMPIKLQRPDGVVAVLDGAGVQALDDAHLGGLIARVFRPGAIHLQKTLTDQGGTPDWHSGQTPRHDRGEALHRVLLWSVSLNHGFEAGETEFLYQRRKVVPRTGSLLIAPAGFTHTHRGNPPRGGHQYIATSWVLYQRAEALPGSES